MSITPGLSRRSALDKAAGGGDKPGVMDFGVSFATAAEHWRVAKRAEALGFSHAWFSDTQLLNADVFVAMAAAAMETSKIRLGSAVAVPSNRIAPVTANALASLNKLAPGRIDFGISTGFTARRTMGLGAVSLAEMAEYIEVVRGLLDCRTVEWAGEGGRRKVRFLNPELGLINTGDPVRFHVSAMGPKSRRLTARLGAGWMSSIPGLEYGAAAIADMRAAWAEAGHPDADLYSTAITGGCVLAEGEAFDSPKAKALAGPAAAVTLHNLVEQAQFGSIRLALPEALKPLLARYRALYESYQPADARYLSLHRGHLLFLRPDEEALITADLIRNTTITGTKAQLREQIRALDHAGFSQFSCHIRYGHESTIEDWADVLDGV